MKKNIYNIGLLVLVGFTGILTSCRESFDFDEARRENPEFVYKENFEKAFGTIDPNQSWDFTDSFSSTSYTRATQTFNPSGSWSTATSDRYSEYTTTYEYIEQNIAPEESNNMSKGIPFQLVMPNNDWEIIPIYKGSNSASILDLYMNVDGTDYKIWDKDHTHMHNMSRFHASSSDRLTVSKNCFDPGASISFWTKVRNDNYTKYPWTTSYRGQERTYEKRYYSTSGPIPFDETRNTYNGSDIKDYNKPYIIYLQDMPELPVDNIGTTTVNGQTIKNEAMLIACEGGGDTDINDIVFLIVGKPYLPKTRNLEGTDVTRKRYMVEDIGAVSTSDIDFNDIVIDITKTQYVKRTFNGTSENVAERVTGTPSYWATVRALGGTKNVAVFLKSTATGATADPTSDPCIFVKDIHSGIEPVTSVVFTPDNTYGSTLGIASGLTASIMYNTVGPAPNSQFSTNSKFTTNSDLYYNDQDSIAHIALSGVTGIDANHQWNPEKNNIYVVVYDDGKTVGVDDLSAEGSARVINFPNNGEIPFMIALPTTQKWNWERFDVFTTADGNFVQLSPAPAETE